MSTTNSTIHLFVHSLDTRSERRYDLHTTVEQLKAKLETVTGIPIDAQSIAVYRNSTDAESGQTAPITVLDDESRPLGYYGVTDQMVLKVSDRQAGAPGSLTGQFTDVSVVEKFELTEEEYANRQDTVLAFKQRNKIGRFAELEAQPTTTDTVHAAPPSIVVGARCEVKSDDIDELQKRGTVRFVGATKFGKGGGDWVGVEYDEPVGKNDGSVDGERYFNCTNKYGAFVRPERVVIGDFPVEDILGDDDNEEI